MLKTHGRSQGKKRHFLNLVKVNYKTSTENIIVDSGTWKKKIFEFSNDIMMSAITTSV